MTSRALAIIAVLAGLAIPRIGLADWQPQVDTDCACDRALPGKPELTEQPSPWPKQPWHRSEVRVSPTEWYAVSYAMFDKAPAAKVLDTALAGLHGTVVSRTPGKQQLDARVKLGDGTTIAVRFIQQGSHVYALEAGDVAKGTKPDKLFAGFHAWTVAELLATQQPGSVTGNAIYGAFGSDTGGGGGYGRLGLAGGGSGSAGSSHAHGAPEMRLGHVDIQSGSMADEVVRRVLAHAHDKLLGCYKRRLAKISTLDGDVHVRFTIEANGKPSHVDANGLDAELDMCLNTALGALAFPTSSDGKPTTAMTILDFAPSPK